MKSTKNFEKLASFIIMLSMLFSSFAPLSAAQAAPGDWGGQPFSIFQGVQGLFDSVLSDFQPPVLGGVTAAELQAAPPPTINNGSISIEPLAAYNLIVDSNVLAPSSYGPNSATLGAKFCNTTGSPISNVWAYIGDYGASTPGTYPQLNPTTYTSYATNYASFAAEFPHLANYAQTTTTDFGDTGRLYALEHESGRTTDLADASRYIGTLAAGECRTQYWVVTYPRKALINGSWVDVTGGVKPNDDLWLAYDFWATSGASNAVQANTRRFVTMRNEISAMANKIWPNGDNKVPDVYKNAITDTLGWETVTPSGYPEVYPGQKVITTQGIWYDFGNVNQGFDNDRDGVPDYNAWVQPIGDAASFDPGCFRLVRTYGLIIVKQQGGKETLIPFVDQLYFENLPADNTGVVGLVYYQYMAIDGVCTAGLTPYQEVASGRDNEKFNADYGAGIPPLTSQAMPTGSITKTANPTSGLAVPNGTIAYTIGFRNDTTVPLGAPEFGLPLVISDKIPTGTRYVPGTAAAGNTLPTGVTAYNIFYSTDNGVTWTSTEPLATPSPVTDIEWWLSDPLPAGVTNGVVTFSVQSNNGSGPIFRNVAGLGLGRSAPFATDDAVTLAGGSFTIGDFVWRDENNDKAQTGETGNGINNVKVTLYYDVNNNNELDSGDLWLQDVNTYTNTNPGYYQFTGLPNGEYLVVVDAADPDLPYGYRYTTPTTLAVTVNGGNVTTADFGFGPTLALDKILLNNPAYEAQRVTYLINVTNRRPGTGTTIGGNCVYEFWSTSGSTPNPPKNFTQLANAFGEPDGLYAYGDFAIGSGRWIRGTGFNAAGITGTITQVDAIIPMYLSATLSDDSLEMLLVHSSSYTNSYSTATLNGSPTPPSYIGAGNARELTWSNIPAANAPGGSWDFGDFASLTLELDPIKSGGADASLINVDAMGFRVTASGVCPAQNPADTMVTVPLTDTYDTAYLEFLEAVPPATNVNTTTGLITWDNIGPILPGETQTVVVRFTAKDIGASPVTFDNTATTTGTRFADGGFANNGTDAASGTMNPTGTINGYVFSDPNGDGWAYNPGGGDLPIAGVTVSLYACVATTSGNNGIQPGDLVINNHNSACSSSQNGNGEWQVRRVAVTDSSGFYEFKGLLNGYYYVQVSSGQLPGTVTQTAEANDAQTVTGTLPNTTANGADCGTCNSIWGNSASNLGTGNFNPINSPGETIAGVNFGYSINPGVYGTVWEDVNANGSKTTGEPMISGVTVRLCADADCASVIATTTTDSAGRYQFGNLTAGTTYYIKTDTSIAPLNSGWTQTGESDGSVNNTISFTAVAGTLSGSHDFGFQKTGSYSISGNIYADWDGNGSKAGSGEPGFAGITVRLYDDATGVLRATTTTNANGDYSFGSLPPGDYSVVVVRSGIPTDYVQTGDPDSVKDDHTDVTIVDANIINRNFGYQPNGTASIGDTVWRDMNGNGLQSGPTETGIANITAWLEVDLNNTNNWVRVATTSTDSSGSYLFSGLSAGKYRVVVDSSDPQLPAGPGGTYVPSTATTTSAITIASGEAYRDADFGFKPLASIGDMVYWDVNGNGEQDWSDPGIAGVTVQLINATGGPVTYNGTTYANGAVMATTTTSSGAGGVPVGFYTFTGLPTGSTAAEFNYTVRIPSPPGTQTADPDRDGEACDKTDIYPNSGAFACNNETTTGVFPGTVYTGADFGYQPARVIGDYVWLDLDGDGIQDEYEVGLPGVRVRLCTTADCSTVVAHTYTDIDGYYSFVGIADGAYHIVFDQQPLDMISTTNLNAARSIQGNGSVGGSTTLVVSGGNVTQIGGEACAGDCDLNLDSGFRYDANNALSGTICLEPVGADGLCNGLNTSGVASDESAYQNVLVYLYRLEDGVYTLVGATTTNGSGDYSFGYLPNGTYRVGVSAPESGLILNTTNAALTKNNNGDGESLSAFWSVGINNNSPSNLDFAYATTVRYDYGDLPDTYSTLNSNDGARHIVPVTPNLYFGQRVGNELNGVPTSSANGDDPYSQDPLQTEEDGVTFNQPAEGWKVGINEDAITVAVFNNTGSPAYIYAWMDFDGNGTFDGEDEFIVRGYEVPSTGNVVSYNLPLVIPASMYLEEDVQLYARFRLFPQELPDEFVFDLDAILAGEQPQQPAITAFYGTASNGEIEDYFETFGGVITPVTLSYFRAERRGVNINFEWATATETGNIGFNLYVETGGQLQRVNPELILSRVIDSLEPQDYTFRAKASGDVFYIEDVSVTGETVLHGPFKVGEAYGERVVVQKTDNAAIAREFAAQAAARQAALRKDLKLPAVALRESMVALPQGPQLSNTVNIRVNQTGIQRVTYEMLRGAGLDLNRVPANKISIMNRGHAVPVHIVTNPRAQQTLMLTRPIPGRPAPSLVFGPGSYIEFYGEALDTLYTDTNIYTVQVVNQPAGNASRMPGHSQPVNIRSQPAAYYMETLVVNKQNSFGYQAPGDDPWFNTRMLVARSANSWEFNFEVVNLSEASMASTLEIVLWGGTALEEFTPDHRVLVSVNNIQFSDVTFDGMAEHIVKVNLPAGTLREGTNILRLTLPGNTGAPYDMVYLDKFSLTYPRTFRAEDGRLVFTSAGATFKVTNLPSSDAVVYRLDEKGPTRLTWIIFKREGDAFSATFAGAKQPATYLVTSGTAINRPALEATRLKTDLNQSADFLIISHPHFIEGLAPLVTARRAEGLTVNVVDVEDLYAQYSYGIFEPQAVQAYIRHAAANLGARYVLLVGGDTFDYRNFTGNGGTSFIPSLYAQTIPELVRFIPVDPLYADLSGDGLPNLPIGRFPVRTQAELALMVKKTLDYGKKNYAGTAVFVSDQYDPQGVSFKDISNGMTLRLSVDWSVENIHLDDLTVSAARQKLLAAMNRGTAVVTYTGHSDYTRWSFSGLFNTTHISPLSNAGRPFVAVQWGCWNLFHVNPNRDFMVQNLLFSGDKGAVAVLGSVSLANSDSQQMLGELFTPRMTQPGMRLGDALQSSKAELARTNPELLDVLLGWMLMGDPTLVIQP